jgi:hypothetical protein
MNLLETARNLSELGFTPKQADGLAETMGRSIGENIATKSDLETLGANLRSEMANLKVEMASVKTEMANVKTEMASLKVWIMATAMTVAGFAILIDKLIK